MIVYQNGAHDVRKVKRGHYEVCQAGVTAAVVVATIHFSNDDARARARAIEECDKREKELQIT